MSSESSIVSFFKILVGHWFRAMCGRSEQFFFHFSHCMLKAAPSALFTGRWRPFRCSSPRSLYIAMSTNGFKALAGELRTERETPMLNVEIIEGFFTQAQNAPVLATLRVRATNLHKQQTTLTAWRLEIKLDDRALEVTNERILTRLVVHRESLDTANMDPTTRPLLMPPLVPIAELEEQSAKGGFFKRHRCRRLPKILRPGPQTSKTFTTKLFSRLTLTDTFGGEHVAERPKGPWKRDGTLSAA